MYLPENFVQKASDFIKENDVDLISANVFPNHEASLKGKIVAAMQSVFPMRSSYWGFKVTRCGRYLYNNNPKADFLYSQTGSGNCILCRKRTFIESHFDLCINIERPKLTTVCTPYLPDTKLRVMINPDILCNFTKRG